MTKPFYCKKPDLRNIEIIYPKNWEELMQWHRIGLFAKAIKK